MSNLLPAPISPLLRDAQGVWGRLASAQKITLAGVAGVVIVVLGLFANMARTPEYAVAFSGLRDDDAAAIVAKLKDGKTPYQLGEQGTGGRIPRGCARRQPVLAADQPAVRDVVPSEHAARDRAGQRLVGDDDRLVGEGIAVDAHDNIACLDGGFLGDEQIATRQRRNRTWARVWRSQFL